MCRNKIIVIDCVCTQRVVEIFEKINECDCVKVVLFQKLEMTLCPLCEEYDKTLVKIYNVIEHILSEDNLPVYYYEDPSMCVETIFR